ncbi:hypothetical protein PPYR_04224 [Photinus pyralis]|uniref:Angiotensin-converting enzyme n=5 Tax=Photinus pyralis TaxID=7054 RepID=A0A5N4AXR5_PHOPY|nr:uncharacterized protein LOC116164613 [Photinus pyralis]KAB0802038.1 hypothetical protein PPYR_04224 [Photinus pyralis]
MEIYYCILIFSALLHYINGQTPPSTEEEVTKYLKTVYEQEASRLTNLFVEADWNFATDIANVDKEKAKTAATLQLAKYTKEQWEKVFNKVNATNYKDPLVKRQIQLLKVLGNAALSEVKLKELTSATNSMTNVYSTAKICPYKKPKCNIATEGLSLEPGIESIISNSNDYEELQYVWKAWRDATGAKMKSTYKQYVDLSNEAAKLNGFNDKGQMWKNDYESPKFEADMDKLWAQVKPLYDELHTYVARKLKKKYGNKIDITDGLIPAHVLGNMWGQSWINIGKLVKPFPNVPSIDVTAALKEKNRTVLELFKESDTFYKSLGLEPNDMSYNETLGAVITKPKDRDILCHASAWDFSNGKDFRIKMCTQVNYEDFVTVHHEMGHIQYFLLYKGQPIAFRNGANPGFHEAVGDTIALSVTTPKHLEKIGLATNYISSLAADLNVLMDMALERIAFLPFGLLIDKWRWDVFSGKVPENKWNEQWWKYREQIQKIKPPVSRSSNDFDPGAKFHVPGDSQYINYFVAHILEFQLYRSFCKLSRQYDPSDSKKPLHNCDFYQSKEVGQKLRAGLSLGWSKHWKEALKEMTGETDLDGTAIREYFQPLYDFLKVQNQIYTQDGLKTFLATEYERASSSMSNKVTIAEWNLATDLGNPDKQKAQLQASLESAEFDKKYWTTVFQNLNVNDYKDEALKRQLKSLKMIGSAALDEKKLTQLINTQNKMQNIYSTAKICPFDKQKCVLAKEGLSLEPHIEDVMARSRDYDELQYVWKEWRDATGKKMKDSYKTYVTLSNEVAVANGFKNTGEMWQSAYESDTFEQDLDKLWEQVKPLYNELHKYVGTKLKEVYGDKLDMKDGLIPAHVFGNMWAQSWTNLAPLLKPYPNASSVDVTAALIKQEYSVKEMFQLSDDFYQRLGLESCEMSYGDLALIVKPEGREVVCHASAWDFSDGKDFRIKMCTNINYEDLITIHHEMGHIQYDILYKDQPITFRGAANPGFHEAVGDTIALSVATPKHLKKVELLDESYVISKESDLNSLMDMALERVAFLPFGLLIDKWRWDVFAGKVDYKKWNEQWWNYRKMYQKVKAPVSRSEDDFDAGAKYHIPSGSQYINYFVARILQFQIYRSLCKASGQYDPNNPSLPLHQCDFYESVEAGKKLRKGLALGASKHWKVALKEITGEDYLDATAMLEYFDPLYKYLQMANSKDEDHLKEYLSKVYELEASQKANKLANARWDFATDVNNKEKEKKQLEATLENAQFNKKKWSDLFKNLYEGDYKDESLIRQIRFLKVLGNSALNEDKLTELSNAGSYMKNIYSTAKICPFNNKACSLEKEGWSLEPDIEYRLAHSENYEELEYIWSEWRKATGPKMKKRYQDYVRLSNEAAVANGFADKGELWRSSYESRTFIKDMDRIWEQVKPLYNELHRYVLKKLKKKYGDALNMDKGYIPAHLLGNMWAQSWINLKDLVRPFENGTLIDVSDVLQKNYTVKKMFETSNQFYTSLGLESCAMSYGPKAVIEKPKDRAILCHASAWDFSDKKDFRIKMCTERNYEDFITIHHEMGHIEYDILYKNQPISFRDGANPGFHEAIGDTIALSVATPKHLEKIGLLHNYDNSYESSINTLMNMALERVAFLPFGLLIDKWRWDVFAKLISPEKWNSHWWHYREMIQKVTPPVSRNDATDFDPGAKYHIPGDSQYINYFFAHILQFQLYKALCIKAKEYNESSPGTLHTCDYYQNRDAGKLLREGLTLGKSKHWKDALEIMTGSRELDASALLEYFQPLFEFLKKSNGPFPNDQELKNFLTLDYERSASMITNEQTHAEWNFVTDVNNPDKEQAQVAAALEAARFKKIYWDTYFKNLKTDNFKDELLKKQIKSLKLLGNAALNREDFKKYTETVNEMTKIYSTARICPYKQQNCNLQTEGIQLDPHMVNIMATSTDYAELSYVWAEWRRATSGIKNKYVKYVDLSNAAAEANEFRDKGEMWRSSYDSPTFINDMDKLWTDVKPLYDQLHTYVAKKLKEKYKDEFDFSDNLIPAHLLGNMWAQTWTNIFPLVKPYPNATSPNITAALLEQGFTALRMFETSDEFYKSLGLESNHMSYDVSSGAIIEKPTDRDILCHASAWDFSNGADFRIKMCTKVNHEDFITIHHEMGHIQYFILYKDQPITFRDSANPGFHEAVGDTIALSVATPEHLHKIGLLKDNIMTNESSINTLMEMALERVAFLPFGLLIDKWRWDVFSGMVPREEWNSRWWKYRNELQGVKAPVKRTANDFDPAAKYHVAGDSQYINYFVARILQFQMYKALCIEAGQYAPQDNKPLHKCDFYQSVKAGQKLRAGLSLGSSKHWSEALYAITGERQLNASALLEYFEPLMVYLKAQNVEPEESSQLVPIIVGSVVGAVLALGLTVFLVRKFRKKKD